MLGMLNMCMKNCAFSSLPTVTYKSALSFERLNGSKTDASARAMDNLEVQTARKSNSAFVSPWIV